MWRLRSGAQEKSVKVRGPLSANNGEMAVQWAVDGRGIVLRSLWDVGAHLRAGRLVQVLPPWQQEASIWAVYSTRLERSAKVRVCVEFLQEYFAQDASDVARPHPGMAGEPLMKLVATDV